MFGGKDYPAFAAAIEESQVILVYREPFLRMMRDEPDAAVRMFESLSRWLRRLLDQLKNETFLNARAKLASYLLCEVRRQTGKAAGAAHIERALIGQTLEARTPAGPA